MKFDFSKYIGFDWDEGNIEKNWSKHRVSYKECEENITLCREELARKMISNSHQSQDKKAEKKDGEEEVFNPSSSSSSYKSYDACYPSIFSSSSLSLDSSISCSSTSSTSAPSLSPKI